MNDKTTNFEIKINTNCYVKTSKLICTLNLRVLIKTNKRDKWINFVKKAKKLMMIELCFVFSLGFLIYS